MVTEALESKEPVEEADPNMEEQPPEGTINYIFQLSLVNYWLSPHKAPFSSISS